MKDNFLLDKIQIDSTIGKQKGRQETINKEAIRSAMKQKGSTYRNVAKRLKISPSTVYRAMKGYREMDLNTKDKSDEVSKLNKDLENKQEQINQLYMEIQGLKGLIFPEVKEKKFLNLKLFGFRINIEKD